MAQHSIQVLLLEEPSAVTPLRAALGADPRATYQLTVADQLEPGLELLRRTPFDLVLLGIGLPASLARLLSQRPDLPVVVRVDADAEALALQALNAGAADFLTRDAAGSAMAGRVIRHVLERQDLRRKLAAAERRLALIDMPEWEQVEARLRASEEQYRYLFERNPHPMWAYDLETLRFLAVNDAAVEHYGYSRAEFLTMTIADIRPAADRMRLQAHLGQPRPTLMHSGEWRHRLKAGTLIDVEITSHIIKLADRRASLVVAQDITARKQAERALRASEEQYRSLMQSLDSLVTTVTAEGVLLYMNAIAAARLGGTAEDFIGRRMDELFPDSQLESIRQVIQTGEGVVNESQSMVQGQSHWFRTSIQPIHDDRGRVTCALVNSTDIHDMKLAEQKLLELNRSLEGRVRQRTAEVEELLENLRQANVELARAVRSKDEFLATMSHELRTPLSAILAFSESLKAGIYGPLGERHVRALTTIERSGQHLLALINDILDLAKVEAGSMEIVPEPLLLADLCKASLQLVREPALKKALQLTFHLGDPAAIIKADSRRLKQILVNLLSNAVKFTPRGGAVSLNVAVDRDAGLARLTVADTGIGIAAADLDRLFRPFSQLDSSLSRQQEGTGLGLALVRRLTELHGGGVIVESQPGEGSRFTITLPGILEADALFSADPADEAGPARPSLSARRPAAVGRHLLLAEDNPANMAVIGEALEAAGYRLSVARNGREALDQAGALRPDLILMDIQMPEIDGLEAIRRLRARPEFAATPIIALTALAMPGDRERCLQAGANAYLPKPVGLRGLVELIEQLLP